MVRRQAVISGAVGRIISQGAAFIQTDRNREVISLRKLLRWLKRLPALILSGVVIGLLLALWVVLLVR
jgi:hypothetical protein